MGLIALCLLSALVSGALAAPQGSTQAAASGSNAVYLNLEHSVDGITFRNRGQIELRSGSASKPAHQDAPTIELTQFKLSYQEQNSLEWLSEQNAPYRIRLQVPRNGKPVYIMSSVPACSVLSSDFNDNIRLHLNTRGHVVGLTYSVPEQECSAENLDRARASSFSSSISIRQGQSGPAPMKKTEVQMQREAEKGQADNRSFLAKYWYYIVPVVLMMFMGGAEPPAEGSGGEGEAAPGASGAAGAAGGSGASGGGGRRRRGAGGR